MERKVAYYTDPLGEAESKEVRQIVSKKLEQIGLEPATAHTNAAMLSHEMKASKDPRKAAKHVQTEFANSPKLAVAARRVLLERCKNHLPSIQIPRHP